MEQKIEVCVCYTYLRLVYRVAHFYNLIVFVPVFQEKSYTALFILHIFYFVAYGKLVNMSSEMTKK